MDGRSPRVSRARRDPRHVERRRSTARCIERLQGGDRGRVVRSGYACCVAQGPNRHRLAQSEPLRIRGNITSVSNRLAIQALKAEIDGGTVEGRAAYSYPSAAGGSRFDADLKADRLDLDAAVALIRSLGEPQAEGQMQGRCHSISRVLCQPGRRCARSWRNWPTAQR